MKFTDSTWVNLGFASALILLGFIGLVSYNSTVRLLSSAERGQQIGQMVGDLSDLVRAVDELQASARGYIITGDEHFLEPFATAVDTINQRVMTLKGLKSGTPFEESTLSGLDSLVAERLFLFRRNIAVRREKGFDAARQRVVSGEGEDVTREIRVLVRRMGLKADTLLARQDVATKLAERGALSSVVVASALAFIVVALALFLRFRDLRARAEVSEQLRMSNRSLRQLSGHLQSAREEERIRIAREIHDELGQVLTVLKMDMSFLDRAAGSVQDEDVRDRLKGEVKSMTSTIDRTIATVREMITQLRPGILDELGLAAAIEWQAQEFQHRSGIPCITHAHAEESRLTPETSTAAFRILQETLTNVARHSGATEVHVTLTEEDGALLLEVHDNGRGITEGQSQHADSFGLLGIRERVQVFNGDVRIEGAPGHGTTVRVRIPFTDKHRTGAVHD